MTGPSRSESGPYKGIVVMRWSCNAEKGARRAPWPVIDRPYKGEARFVSNQCLSLSFARTILQDTRFYSIRNEDAGSTRVAR
jgi:hypothetical protein